MKYAIIIPDGCADLPIAELGGKTPLAAARVPNMDRVVREGLIARTDNVPRHFPSGSEVANMTLFGYNPDVYFTGRAPIEAAAQGIHLGEFDWAVRCNIVTIEQQVMVDFTADHISTEDAASMLSAMQQKIDQPHLQFVPGVSYRNLLLFRGSAEQSAPFSSDTVTRAPHDLTDLAVVDDFPRGPGSDLLVELMQASVGVFVDHPVNRQRAEVGRRLATNIWLWGLGKSPQLPSFQQRFGLRGAMITGVDLLRGLAALTGWDRIEVQGATGYLDTNYAGKGAAAVEALDRYDVVCVHVEATDEASHEGRPDEKVKALESIDQHIVGPVHEKLKACGDYRLMVLPDHPTFCSTKKHSHGMVPVGICGTGVHPDDAVNYDDATAETAPIAFEQGWELMESFVRKDWPSLGR